MLKKLKQNSFLRDIGITTLGQVVLMLLAFGINKIICVNLSMEDFAVYNIIRRATSVITYAMLMAMGIAVPKYLAMAKAEENKEKFSKYLIASIEIVTVMSSVVAVLISVARLPVAKLIFSEDALAYVSLIFPMALYAVGCAFTTYVYSYYRAVGAFVKYSVSQIALQIFMLVSCIVLGANLQAIIYVWGVGSCIYSVASVIIFLKRDGDKEILHDRKKLKPYRRELIEYGLPRVPGEVFLFAYNLVPLLIITDKFGLIDSSFFSVATGINSTITSLFGFVGVVLLPEVSKSIVNRQLNNVNKKINVLLALYVALSLMAIGFVELFPKFVVHVLYQSEYEAAIPMIRIIIWSILPNALYLLYRNPLDAISKFPYNTVCLGISFGLMVIAMLSAKTLVVCEMIYVLSYLCLGIFSWLIWQITLKREIQRNIG